MKNKEEHIEKMKRIMEEKGGKEVSPQEAEEGLDNLVGLFEILMDMAQEEAKMKAKLKTSPDGYDITGEGYSCCVCRNSANWYDKHGKTCIFCLTAFKENILPFFVAEEYKSYFKAWQLKSTFNVSHQTMKKYIKEGKLVARIVRGANNRPHEYIFLRKENLCLIDRDGPARKSYDRKKRKINDRRIKKERKELKEEYAKMRAPRKKKP